jgi:transcriptional regulator with XRE-family HTH domain
LLSFATGEKFDRSIMPSPTLRTLAKLLGLSRTTISEALRGSPRVKAATVTRVRTAAAAAGYRHNPLAGAVMSELRRSRSGLFRGVLAVVDLDEPDRPASQPDRTPHIVARRVFRRSGGLPACRVVRLPSRTGRRAPSANQAAGMPPATAGKDARRYGQRGSGSTGRSWSVPFTLPRYLLLGHASFD